MTGPATDWTEPSVQDHSGIPLAPDFAALVDADRAVIDLDIGYETCAEHRLEVSVEGSPDDPDSFGIGSNWMKWTAPPDRAVLIVYDHVRLSGIPAAGRHWDRQRCQWLVRRSPRLGRGIQAYRPRQGRDSPRR